jgi:hypothetical protein
MSILLSDRRQIKRVNLPSYPEDEAAIEMYDRMLYSEAMKVNEAKTDFERGVETLRFLIKSWPFVDTEGKTLEVNSESLGKLSVPDVFFLLDTANQSFDFLDKEKSKS